MAGSRDFEDSGVLKGPRAPEFLESLESLGLLESSKALNYFVALRGRVSLENLKASRH